MTSGEALSEEGDIKKKKTPLGTLEMVSLLIRVVAEQVCTCVRMTQTVNSRFVQFIVCKPFRVKQGTITGNKTEGKAKTFLE